MFNDESIKRTSVYKKMSESSVNVEKPNGGGSKVFLIIGILLLLTIGGGLAFLFLTPTGKALLGKEVGPEEVEAKQYDFKNLSFTELPEILLNLRATDGKQVFLKASFIIEASSPKIGEKVEKLKPMLIDQFQVYLRELDIEDLKGSAGVERIRQELVTRTNVLVTPDKINNVLFKEFLVQ